MRRVSMLLVSGAIAVASVVGLSGPVQASPHFVCGPVVNDVCLIVCRAIHRPCL